MEEVRHWGPEDEPDEAEFRVVAGPEDEPVDEGMDGIGPILDRRLSDELDAALD